MKDIEWIVYWTKDAGGTIFDPPIIDNYFRTYDINNCFINLAENIKWSRWEGYVGEHK